MKRISFLCFLFCTYFIVNAQISPEELKASGFSTTSSGLPYKIIKDSIDTPYSERGGFITFWFEMRTQSDSIFDSQFKDPNPVGIPTPDIKYKPSIEEGFALLTEGDSALFLLNADSLYLKTFKRPVPDYIAPQSTIKMIVKMGKIYSKRFVDSVMVIQEKISQAQMKAEAKTYKRDSIIIQKYLKKNKLNGQATIGGAYVVILDENKTTDAYLTSRDTIQTMYVGKLLNKGNEFDRSLEGEYFTFVLGMGQVIRGWDEGFLKLKRGEKAIILIPSRLAYGTRGAGEAIPPNAPLLFEVLIKNK